MAVNITPRVASRAPAGAPTAMDLFNAATKSSPALIPDPRADVMATVGAIPTQSPDPNVPRGIPMLESQSTIETPQDIADIGGAPYPPQADMRPLLDEEGMPILDPVTGEKQYEPIPISDFDQQFQTEKESHFAVKDAVQQMAEGDAYGSQRTLFQEEQRAASTGWGLNAREEHKLNTRTATLDGYIQSSATDLEQVISSSKEALFGRESRAMIGVDGGEVPVGWKVAADAGIYDEETRDVISTLGALSLNQAVTQSGVYKNPGDEVSTEDVQPGKDYQSNMINATRHSLVNGLEKMGIKLPEGSADQMAKALVMHNVYEGHLIPSTGKDGRTILEASSDMKRQAMNLQRVSEAITGDVKRRGASSVPTNSGASFSRGKPQLTKSSLAAAPEETKVADLVKGILGAIAQVYRKKDVFRKTLEIQMVLDPQYITEIDGKFAWSNHPMAERNNLHKGAFDAAKAKVRRDDSFDAKNPMHEAAFKKQQEEGALRVMAEERAKVEFDMKNITKSKGLLYSHWIHGTNNQRFYPNSYNTDYMGSKNIIRDTMALADQDTVRGTDLFNEKDVEAIKAKARMAMSGGGVSVQKKLEALSPNDLGAIGAMRNAVMYYYTALEKAEGISNFTKLAPLDVIEMYTPQIGARLAALGQSYNAVLQDPKVMNDHGEMMALWQVTEKGEALGTLNLWDDFFKAKTMAANPVTGRHSFALTHHAFSDGNQNGIFLQSLFFGLKGEKSSADAALRLSIANPNMDDMRVFGMDSMVQNLKDILEDEPEKATAWACFWRDAIKSHPDGREGVAKDFFKKPLMQNAYGKDASMFTDILLELLEVNSRYTGLVEKYLTQPNGPYRDTVSAGTDLSSAVEGSLRKIIDSSSVNMMKNIGRFMAILNKPIKIKGISGDILTITPVGATPINKSVQGGAMFADVKLPDGSTTQIKLPSYVTDTLTDPKTGQQVELPSYRLQADPSASRGVQKFWNRKKQQYDEFHNPLGTMQARQFAVLMIQAMDGDLVKFTTAEANKHRLSGPGKRNPWPVLFVHDSIIGTAGSSLIYDHVYNNVALPAAIPHIQDMGRRIQKMVHLSVDQEKARVEERGERVGIGSLGDYPSLGALFDDLYDRTVELGEPGDYRPGESMPNDYKSVFLRRERAKQRAQRRPTTNKSKDFHRKVAESEATFGTSPEQAWEKYKHHLLSILQSAKKHGWIPPGHMTPDDREMMTVKAEDFGPLVDLSAEALRMNLMRAWTDEHAARVDNAWKRIMTSSRLNKNILLQMAAGGGKRASKDGWNPKPIKEAEPAVVTRKEPPSKAPDLEHVFDEEPPF